MEHAFPSVWVAGEVQRVRESRAGHLYLELVEKGDRDRIEGRLEAVVWRSDLERIRRLLDREGQSIVDGSQIRCRCNLDFYGPSGRLQAVIRRVDPVFTLGLLARRRRETLQALEAAGLLERNRSLPLAEIPLRVGLVTSADSAAYHDFLSTLREGPYGFRVLFVHAAVQGQEAERQVASALRGLSSAGVDCIALVRGGGSRSDLAAFDSRAIAEAVARCRVPVLTGLGHEIDQAIADIVAHTALKTPTRAAEMLVARVAAADQQLGSIRDRLLREAAEPLREARRRLERAERASRAASSRLRAADARVRSIGDALTRVVRYRLDAARRRRRDLVGRLSLAAPRSTARQDARLGRNAGRLASGGRARVAETKARLAGLARLMRGLAPERTLRRGFSITRDAAGRALRAPVQVASGEIIHTTLAGGDLTSRVEEV